MNKTIIVIIIVAVALVGGYFFLRGLRSSPREASAPPVSGTSDKATPQQPTSQTPATEEKIVTYTDSGYSPGTLTVKRGETVTFKNQSSQSMWTASALHPTHRVYSGTSLDEHCQGSANTAFDACKGILPGGLWSFKFDKTGTFKYHNHLSPKDSDAIVVE